MSAEAHAPDEHPEDPKDDGRRVPGFTYVWMIPYITRIARRHGYAIGVHGSMSRDLDLIAVPWVETASDPKTLVDAVCSLTTGFLATGGDGETKCEKMPHGRVAYTICFHGARHFIDLSIMPLRPAEKTVDGT